MSRQVSQLPLFERKKHLTKEAVLIMDYLCHFEEESSGKTVLVFFIS